MEKLRIFGKALGVGCGILLTFFGIVQLLNYVFPSTIVENPMITVFILMIIASVALTLSWVLSRPQFRFSSKKSAEYPKKDLKLYTPHTSDEVRQIIDKINTIHPNLDFKGIVACAELDYILPYEISKHLNKPFTTVHTSEEWLLSFNLGPFRYDDLSPGDDVILLVWVASNGKVIERVLPLLKKHNILIKSAFCMFEKKNDAREILKTSNIPLYSVYKIKNGYEDITSNE